MLHYSCPPIVGGVEAIISQHAHLLNRHNHLVKIFAGDGGIFTDEVDIELNPLLSSRNPKSSGSMTIFQGNPLIWNLVRTKSSTTWPGP